MDEASSDRLATAQCKLPEIKGVPPHIHEMLTRASIQLLAEKQRLSSLEPHSDDQSLGQVRSGDSFPSVRQSKRKRPTHQDGRLPARELVPISQCKKSNASSDRFTFAWNLITPAGPGYSYSHATNTRFGDQQSDPHRGVQIQINYMDSLASRIPDVSSFTTELRAMESLRTALKKIAQEALELYGDRFSFSVGPKAIDLKCFGGLRNGFSLPGADLDLVICNRLSTFPRGLEAGYLHALKRAFLDAGFRVRMRSGATGPVIRLREIPQRRILSKFGSQGEERGRRETQNECREYSSNSSSTSDRSSERSNSQQPGRCRTLKGVRIECNVDLAETLSIHNTELLRCYALCDERVRQVGVFVKMWAKARGICSPFYGTLCSYGYILMVIHYLMNVAQPPLIPNLQSICQQLPGHHTVATVNGCEVRYYSDEAILRSRATYNTKLGNRQSVGDLLRGFFAYYGSIGRGAPLGGFHWASSTVSIRTPGGTVSKHSKGWYLAKTHSNGKRLRYLLAVEDPFEHDNNVASSVTKAGVGTIRTEFCRAWAIIQRVQEIPGAGWEWRTSDGGIGQDFLADFRYDPTSVEKSPRAQDSPAHYQDGNRQDNSICESTSRPQCKPGSYPQSTDPLAKGASHWDDTQNAHARSCQTQERGTEKDPIQLDSAGAVLPGQSHHSGQPSSNAPLNRPKSELCVPYSPLPAAGQNTQRDSLIRPAAVANKQHQETCREDFLRRATLAANNMRCLLHTPELRNANELELTPEPGESVGRNNPNDRTASVDSNHSRMVGDVVEPARSNTILSQQTISTTPLQCPGIALDSRQFHSPNAIRDRSFKSRRHPQDEENFYSGGEAMDSSTSGRIRRGFSGIPEHDMLLTLPYNEASVC